MRAQSVHSNTPMDAEVSAPEGATLEAYFASYSDRQVLISAPIAREKIHIVILQLKNDKTQHK